LKNIRNNILLALMSIVVVFILFEIFFDLKEYIFKRNIAKAYESVGNIKFSVVKDSIDSLPAMEIFSGSCFIVLWKNQKIIITVNHLQKHAKAIADSLNEKKIKTKIRIVIRFPNDKSCEADTTFGDNIKDFLIIIPKKPNTLPPPIEFGNSDKIQILDDVVAIGRHYSLPILITSGKVIDPLMPAIFMSIPMFDYCIISTAQVTYGSSGGALLNKSGQVIGINIGFSTENKILISLPINQLKNFLKENYNP